VVERSSRPPDLDGSNDQPADPAKRETLRKLAIASGLVAAGGLPLTWLAGCGRRPRVPPEIAAEEQLRRISSGASIVICVLDAARCDHLGCYGYARETTPNIDELAKESLVFENHFCQVSHTKASTASLFTSQYPGTHLTSFKRDLDRSTFTIARGLGDAGYNTALFSSNPFASPITGACHPFQENCGLDEAADMVRGSERRESPEPLLRLFESWLERRASGPFFAYVHLLPPHKPYAAPADIDSLFRGKEPPDWSEKRYHPEQYSWPVHRHPDDADNPALTPPDVPVQDWINLYDANLRYGDWAVGELGRLLREAELLEETILIITSDHGEAFGEHGFVLHACAIHDELAKIPLLLRFPKGGHTGRIAALTQSIDLLPTLFQLLGAPYPEESIQGRSLVPLLAGAAEAVNSYSFTHALFDRGKYMVRNLDYALLLFGNGLWRALYDMEADPEQEHNIIEDEPQKADELIEVFRAFAETQREPMMHFLRPKIKEAAPPPPLGYDPGLSPEVKRDLEALGYLK
jgi:arylsulfatase A-like enzyme